MLRCPQCGSRLLYCVKTVGQLYRRINKNGELSKVLHKGSIFPTDVYYLECDNYKCRFIYNLSYPQNNERSYQELDDWYDEYGENIE